MRKRRFIFHWHTILILLLLLVSWIRTGECIHRELGLDSLTLKADVILMGDVVEKASMFDTSSTLITLTNIEVTSVIFLDTTYVVDDTITIQSEGGKIGDIEIVLEAEVSFEEGERVLVFLQADELFFSVIGGYQGKFNIINGNVQKGDKTWALNDFIAEIESYLGGK